MNYASCRWRSIFLHLASTDCTIVKQSLLQPSVNAPAGTVSSSLPNGTRAFLIVASRFLIVIRCCATPSVCQTPRIHLHWLAVPGERDWGRLSGWVGVSQFEGGRVSELCLHRGFQIQSTEPREPQQPPTLPPHP